MRKILLSVLLMLSSMMANAYDAYIGGIYYNLNAADKTAEVTYYENGTINGKAPNASAYWGTVEIPSEVTYNDVTYSVTGIGFYAFNYCSSLGTITIPNSVTYIDSSAFAYCTALSTINIPNSVTSIGSYAFEDTRWYKNQQDGLVYAGKVAYHYKGTMPQNTSISIKDGTLGIAGNAFSNCPNLKSISIPNSVTKIGTSAFYECTGLTSFTFPANMTSIDGWVLQGCSGLTSINIPESVTSIGDWTFSSCSSLASITIPRNVTSIGKGAFMSCNHLLRVVMESNTPPTIEENTFPRRSYMTLCVPEGCKDAYTKANYWQDFKNIYDEIVEVVASYIDFADAYVKKLCVKNWDTDGDEELSVEEAAAVESLGTVFQNEKYIDSFDEFRYFTNVTTLSYSFIDCKKLKSIALPNSILSIKSFAFRGCIKLTEINIPEKVNFIEGYSFDGCTNLTTVIIPKNVVQVGSMAFYGCNNLTTVIVEWDTPIAIAENVFPNRSNATLYVPAGSKDAYLAANYWKEFKEIVEESVATDEIISFADPQAKSICVANWDSNCDGELSESEAAAVTYLGNVFQGSEITSFNELRYFKKLLSIDANAFRDCSSLTSVILPNDVKRIGDRAFYNCISLSSITVPDGVNRVGYRIFDNTAWFNNQPDKQVAYIGKIAYKYKGDMPFNTHLTLKEGTIAIASEAFENCSGLESITLPNSVTFIGKFAFMSCNNMETVSLGFGVTVIDEFAFASCINLKTINAIMRKPVDLSDINSVFSSSIFSKATLHVFKGYKSAYQNADIWKDFSTITDDITYFYEQYPFGRLSFNIINDADKTCEVSGGSYLTGKVIIPSSIHGYHVIGIDEDAFEDEDFTDIVIPSSITYFKKRAFKTTIENVFISDLESWCKITISSPYSNPLSGSNLYVNNELITDLIIPGNITTIKACAFQSCKSITSVTIHDNVTLIGSSAFSGCSDLTSVSIGSGVTSIESSAFNYCNNLTSVTLGNSAPVGIDSYCFSNRANATLYVPAGSVDAYKAADYWKEFKEIKEIVTPNDGSAENPFSCAEAYKFVAELTADTPTETEYYIKGKVSTMISNFGYQSGHATFMISDDGTKNGEFTVSQSLYFGKQAYDGGRIPNIGDEVMICGKLINLNGTIHQTANEDCQLVSITGKTTALPLEYGDLFSSMTADYSKDLFFVAGCMTEPGKPNSENMGCSIGYAVGSRPETNSGAPTAIDADYEGAVVLPESADGLELRTIAPSAFAGAKLTSIVIPATVWDIETDAFNGCTNLASVSLPEGVTLNRRSFQDCTALTSVSLPKGVILYGLDGEFIFGGCTNLTSITVNDETPYELQDNCIIDNPGLVTLYVPAGSKAAYEVAEYWKNFKIEEQGVVWAVTSTDDIPAGTKYELDNITLTIGEAGSPDFSVNPEYGAYDETFEYPIIGNGINGNKEGGTFYLFTPKKNGNLTVIVRQGKTKQFYVEESGRVMDAFNGLLPETDEDTYKGTYTIPVFANLTYKVYCAGSKMGFYGFTFEGRNDADETNITFADEKVKALCVAAKWNTNDDQELSLTEAAAVTTLGDVFKENSEITSFDELRFFTGLTDISGWDVFYNCNALTSVTIPATVTSLDGATFAGCSALEQISVDPGNTVYCTRQNGNAIIEKATNKLVVGNKTGEIPDGVTVIGADAFHGRHQLQWIGIPESVTELENGAFSWCTGLEGVEIPSSVQKIGGWAFTGTSLWGVTLPEGLTTIGENAFEGCNNLYEVTVQNQEPLALQNDETFSNRANATLFVPSGCKAAYLAADYWKDFKLIAEGVVAEKKWDGPKWAFSYEGTDATCEVTAEGLALYNPRKQEEMWTPQTSVTDDCLTLVEGHDYKVRLTAKVPSDGTYQVQLGNWGGCDQYWIEATANNEPQIIEIDFQNFCCNVDGDGHVIFQNGFVVGTTIVQNVEVIDTTDGEEIIGEQSWTGPYWFGEEETGAKYEMTAEGLAINNPTANEDLWRPQTSVLEHATLQEGHGYKVIITAKIPSDGNLQVQIGNWEKEQMCAIPVQASEDFQDIEAVFEGYTGNNNGHVLFQNGGIAGTSIVKFVKIIDLGLNPDYVPELANAIYVDDQTGNKGRTFTMDIKLKNENPVRAYSFDLQLPEGVTIAKDANGDYEMELSGRHDSYAPTVNYIESSNTYKLGATSRIAGNDGVIMTLRLQVSDQMPTGEYFIRILNAIYTQADNYQDIHMPEASAKLTIGENTYTKGDVNDDDDVDIADVVCVVNHVVGIETPRYYEAAADVTGDNDVTISDAAKIVDYIIGEIDALGPIAATVRRLALSRSMNDRNLTGILEAATLNDALYANDLVVKPGNATPLTISLKNANETNGYMFDLILPDGVKLAKDGNNYKCVLSSRHHSSHGVNIKYKEDTRTYSVLVYSQSSKSLSGNDGEVLTFTLDVTDAVASDATLSIQNCKYSLTSGASKVTLPREEVKLIKKGDADGNGEINMSDVIIMLSYLLGENPENFNADAADMNGDGKVTITDVLLMYDLIP